MKTLKIGNVRIPNPIFLSPMVEVTDLPYRLICRKAGAGMAYIEMLYVNAILHTNKKTQNLMKTSKEDRPSGIQITGNTPEEFKKVIPHLKPYDIVDINCGCPSIRIVGSQAGSFLLKTPKKIESMIRILKDAGLTTTAKIRLGFNKNNVLKVSKLIEKAGADALTIHARLAVHRNHIPAEWSWIKKVKDNLGIPVIGNGDIVNGESAAKMLDIADGAMIARAALGDPTIFSRVAYYLKTRKEKEFDFKENIRYFNRYLQLAKKYDVIDLNRIKYLGTNFIKSIQGAASLRQQFMGLKTFNEIQDFSKSLEEKEV
ncbi:tRNA-dihydrouridine synthase family protein [Candidatus Pacearchaeota archaeon]|nr:tRNA-dihydrouridine synthase family protein [Candidatus Pacearchaeota archaeon]